MDFFYDNQIRRYILQFQRIFSNMKTERADGRGGTIQSTIPIVRGDMSRNVASILQGNTQNATMPIPCFSVSIERLTIAPERRATPTHESAVHTTERHFDGVNYTNRPGNRTTVERYMGVPYDLYVNLGILTSNIDTKLQIIEQIMTIFNPALQLTQTDNYLDWTSVFEVELMDITWSEDFGDGRTISTLNFKIPIWINPPAKIKRQTLIEQIVTNLSTNIGSDESIRIGRSIVSPGDCSVNVEQNGEGSLVLTLTPNHESFRGNWVDLLALYGKVEMDTTKISLNGNSDIEDFSNVIVGYVTDIDEMKLTLTIDVSTLPSPTLAPVLDLLWSVSDIPISPNIGDRYILVDSTGSTITNVEDGGIIEMGNTGWFSTSPSSGDIVTVLSQFTMVSFDESWAYSYLGEYVAGYWRILDMITSEIENGTDC